MYLSQNFDCMILFVFVSQRFNIAYWLSFVAIELFGDVHPIFRLEKLEHSADDATDDAPHSPFCVYSDWPSLSLIRFVVHQQTDIIADKCALNINFKKPNVPLCPASNCCSSFVNPAMRMGRRDLAPSPLCCNLYYVSRSALYRPYTLANSTVNFYQAWLHFIHRFSYFLFGGKRHKSASKSILILCYCSDIYFVYVYEQETQFSHAETHWKTICIARCVSIYKYVRCSTSVL